MGALEHKDSMGNGSVLRPGEFQRMSAGTGVRHSEFNPSRTEPVHFYQIWLMLSASGIKPSYEQKLFGADELRGRLRLVASPNGADGSLTIYQDARVYLATLDAGDAVSHVLPGGQFAWLQVIRGRLKVNELALDTSDGLAVSEESQLEITATGSDPAELMLFDLA
jgi:redox-sensitive bicupin YhaK (pirin superfamily)